VLEFLDALGASFLRALVTIRADQIIAAAAFLQFAIAAANEAERLNELLRAFFAILAIVFGVLSAVLAIIFVVGQLRPPRAR
jgi:hypothetical protein